MCDFYGNTSIINVSFDLCIEAAHNKQQPEHDDC